MWQYIDRYMSVVNDDGKGTDCDTITGELMTDPKLMADSKQW